MTIPDIDDRPLPWLRLNCDFASSPRVQRLSEAMQRRYVMLLCLAGQRHLPTDDDDVVRFALRLTAVQTAKTKEALVAAGLIGDDWMPASFEKYAKPSDHDGWERTKRWREKKAAESDSDERRHGDVTVTVNGRDGTNERNKRDGRTNAETSQPTQNAVTKPNGTNAPSEISRSIPKDPFPRSSAAGRHRHTDDFERINDAVAKVILDGKTSPDDIDGIAKAADLSENQVRKAVKQLRDRNRIPRF